jgi:hypothetical protein
MSTLSKEFCERLTKFSGSCQLIVMTASTFMQHLTFKMLGDDYPAPDLLAQGQNLTGSAMKCHGDNR